MKGRFATHILHATGIDGMMLLAGAGAHFVGVKDGRLYQKQLDRIRMGLFSSIGRLWRGDLNGELRNLMRATDSFEHPAGWRSAVEAEVVKHFRMDSTFDRTYVTVFPLIAERVFDGLVDAPKSFGRGFEQKADPEDVAAWERAALEWIRTEGGSLITGVELYSHALVVRHVRRLTERALAEGWSISRLKREFQSKMISLNDFRARMIARTEVMRAGNLGSREAALTTGLDLIKEWLVGPLGTGDRHATLEYAVLHDQRRDMDQLYEFKGHTAMYPLDLRLPPEESIQCRCSERYIPRDMQDQA